MPPKKKIAPGQDHGYIGVTKSKAKTPKPFIEPPAITQYRYDRDMSLLYDLMTPESSKEEIRKFYNL